MSIFHIVYGKQISSDLRAKSFPSLVDIHRSVLISGFSTLSYTPDYAARRRIWMVYGVPVYSLALTGTQCAYRRKAGQAEWSGWIVTYRDCLATALVIGFLSNLLEYLTFWRYAKLKFSTKRTAKINSHSIHVYWFIIWTATSQFSCHFVYK